ncbi:MAG: carbonic anhydrase family protein [Nitrosomonadaceae bacterium]|jgi:carbonic anhydrase|nr:carbonic anhydrase family protein [Nitrosomonadaceae bacterium]
MSKKISSLLFLCLPLLLTSCANQQIKDVVGISDSPHNEAGLYIQPELGHGHMQSPINIRSFKERTSNGHQITLNYKDEIKAVENLGHTVQLDFKAGSTVSYEGIKYDFKQMHFHTPSEHLIDGMTFPMEMHIVSTEPLKDKNTTPHYLVLGILFKEGKNNKFLDEFLNKIPKTEHTLAPLEVGAVKLDDLLYSKELNDVKNFYHYLGSLTTPPYTQTVQWFVFKHIMEASPEQIEAINAIEGNNARHIQGIFARSVD